jgi:hypothetical protein
MRYLKNQRGSLGENVLGVVEIHSLISGLIDIQEDMTEKVQVIFNRVNDLEEVTDDIKDNVKSILERFDAQDERMDRLEGLMRRVAAMVVPDIAVSCNEGPASTV